MDLFSSSCEGWKTHTLFGPLERANMSGRKQIQFPKRCVFYFLEYRLMDNVQKPSNSELHYRIWKYGIQGPIVDEINPFHALIHFNITLPSTPRRSKWYLLFGLSDSNNLRISSFACEYCIPGHLFSLLSLLFCLLKSKHCEALRGRCKLIRLLVTSCLLVPDISSEACFHPRSIKPSLENKFHIFQNNKCHYISVYLSL
jgi:hypothetical protein